MPIIFELDLDLPTFPAGNTADECFSLGLFFTRLAADFELGNYKHEERNTALKGCKCLYQWLQTLFEKQLLKPEKTWRQGKTEKVAIMYNSEQTR